MGASAVEQGRGGVHFRGSAATCYAANLWRSGCSIWSAKGRSLRLGIGVAEAEAAEAEVGGGSSAEGAAAPGASEGGTGSTL